MDEISHKKPISPIVPLIMALGAETGQVGDFKIIKHKKSPPPWHTVNLTKSERKGKTPEEIQELRRQRWYEKQRMPVPVTLDVKRIVPNGTTTNH